MVLEFDKELNLQDMNVVTSRVSKNFLSFFKVPIRFQFPDKTVVQAFFRPLETGERLMIRENTSAF